MITATVKELKEELKHKTNSELITLCLSLSKFKKENKELLTYLLFEASNEDAYIEHVKDQIKLQIKDINVSSVYFIKKSCQKILRSVKKHIRYSKKKETEIELLSFFCIQIIQISPRVKESIVLKNLIERQVKIIKKSLETLHEDLQEDHRNDIELITIFLK